MSKKIVIDPGHGGDDPGTIKNGITEKDYTLKISNYMKKKLDDLGIENSITRTSDETLGPSDRPKRVQSFYGNGSDVIVLSNHINAGGGDGAEIIYALRNSDNLSSKIASELESAGQNVRKYYQRRLPSNPAKDYYYIQRDTPNNETIIVEYGFADSTGDDVSQLKNNWESLAEAVVKALASYVGVKYTSPVVSDTYTVKSGDTLWSIARKFNTTVDKLKEINNLSSNTLSIGQVLKLTGDNSPSTYTVKKGDTLYSIANKYGMSVNELKSINNLSTNLLSIGQVLKIKKDIDVTPKTYIVQKGDTLYSIARKNNTTVSDIIDLNNLSSTNLSIGQKLILPN